MPIDQIIYAEDRSDCKMAKNLLSSCENMLFFLCKMMPHILLCLLFLKNTYQLAIDVVHTSYNKSDMCEISTCSIYFP